MFVSLPMYQCLFLYLYQILNFLLLVLDTKAAYIVYIQIRSLRYNTRKNILAHKNGRYPWAGLNYRENHYIHVKDCRTEAS